MALLVIVGQMQSFAETCKEALPEIATALQRIATEWTTVSMSLGARAQADVNEVGGASVDYLMYSGYALLTYFWARMAFVAHEQLQRGDDPS
jgi:hypothetical protein